MDFQKNMNDTCQVVKMQSTQTEYYGRGVGQLSVNIIEWPDSGYRIRSSPLHSSAPLSSNPPCSEIVLGLPFTCIIGLSPDDNDKDLSLT